MGVNARRIAFCLTIAPMLIMAATVMTVMVPLLAFFAWMRGKKRPWAEAWDTVWGLAISEIRNGYAMTSRRP